MSNNRHRVSLKQLTPIIHFQHEQKGACLRASEVRPKLDRFLTGKFADINQSGTDFSLEIDLIQQAMDKKLPAPYKLRIIVPKSSPDYYFFDSHIKEDDKRGLKTSLDESFGANLGIQLISPSPYFAHQDKHKDGRLIEGKKDEIRLAIKETDIIILEVFSLNTRMVALVKEALPSFFMTHNFGSRQSKGFGCFQLENAQGYKVEEVLKKYFVAGLECKKSVLIHEVAKLFEEIDTDYKKIKSAEKNESLIKEYFEDNDILWEKEFIKNVFIEKGNAQEEGFKYIRALLGLAEQHEHNVKTGGKNKKIQVKISDKGSEIERFASPLLFKIYEKTLYLMAKPIEKEMFNRPFTFKGNDINGNLKSKTLHTPKKEDFNMKEFMQYLHSKLSNWKTL